MVNGTYATKYDAWVVGIGLPLLVLFGWGVLKGSRGVSLSGVFAPGFRILSLRAKFLATIVLITGLTAAIIFWSLSNLETRLMTAQIERQSAIFTRFSTERLISDFVQDYQHRYLDRFLPAVRELIASDEDVVSIRIISAQSRNVLFDSETIQSSPADSKDVRSARGVVQARFSREAERELLSRDLVSERIEKNGESLFSVVNTFRSDAGEALFLAHYVFSYASLGRKLHAIRRQIILDLGPAVALGFLVALFFAQLLISPIRKLRSALGRVTSGDYSAQLAISNQDEIGELAAAFNLMTEELRRKKELRKYLSHSSYQRITLAAGGGEGKRLGGKRVPATVLFSDIRGFVSLCESMDAEEVTSLLNEYFSEMVEVIHRQGGEVDKFIGDAILAVFYADEENRYASGGTASLQAIYCALGMKDRLLEFNLRRSRAGKPALEIGIGISHGEIISGPIGSDDRLDFTVIGDVVNLANRIEKLSKNGKHTRVLFSDSVEVIVRNLLDYEEMRVEGGIRGKADEVRVFELIGIKDLETMRRHLKLLGPESIDLRVRSVEILGQSGNEQAIEPLLEALDDPAEAVRVSCCGALARASKPDDERVLAILFSKLREERSFKVLSALIASVGRICHTDRILEIAPFLGFPAGFPVDFFNDDRERDRIIANAIEALGQSRVPRGTDLILPFLASPNNRIKANAAMALFGAGRVEVIDTLKPMLMHSEPLMRSSAAFAIGELTLIADMGTVVASFRENAPRMRFYLAELQDCVPMLVSLLRDPDQSVRRQAIIALGKIKDKSAVLPMIELLDLKVVDQSKDELAREVLEALREIGSHKIVRETLAKLS